jgi:hypothetical protein
MSALMLSVFMLNSVILSVVVPEMERGGGEFESCAECQCERLPKAKT